MTSNPRLLSLLFRRCTMPVVKYEDQSWVTLIRSFVDFGFRENDPLVQAMIPSLVHKIPKMTPLHMLALLNLSTRLKIRSELVVGQFSTACTRCPVSVPPERIAQGIQNLYDVGCRSRTVFESMLRRIESVFDNISPELSVQCLIIAGRYNIKIAPFVIELILRRIPSSDAVSVPMAVTAVYSASRLLPTHDGSVDVVLSHIIQKRQIRSLVKPLLCFLVHSLRHFDVKNHEIARQAVVDCLYGLQVHVDDLQLVDVALAIGIATFYRVNQPATVLEKLQARLFDPKSATQWCPATVTTILNTIASSSDSHLHAQHIEQVFSWCSQHSAAITIGLAYQGLAVLRQTGKGNPAMEQLFQTKLGCSSIETPQDLKSLLMATIRDESLSTQEVARRVEHCSKSMGLLQGADFYSILYECVRSVKRKSIVHLAHSLIRLLPKVCSKHMTWDQIHTVLKFHVLYSFGMQSRVYECLEASIQGTSYVEYPLKGSCDILTCLPKYNFNPSVSEHVINLISKDVGIMKAKDLGIVLISIYKAQLWTHSILPSMLDAIEKMTGASQKDICSILTALSNITQNFDGTKAFEYCLKLVAADAPWNPPSLTVAACALASVHRRKSSAHIMIETIFKRHVTVDTLRSSTTKDLVTTVVSCANLGWNVSKGLLKVIEEQSLVVSSQLLCRDVAFLCDALQRIGSRNTEMFENLYKCAIQNISYASIHSLCLLYNAMGRCPSVTSQQWRRQVSSLIQQASPKNNTATIPMLLMMLASPNVEKGVIMSLVSHTLPNINESSSTDDVVNVLKGLRSLSLGSRDSAIVPCLFVAGDVLAKSNVSPTVREQVKEIFSAMNFQHPMFSYE
eukprot:PhF_6_TR4521/c0_g1_i1/m.6322